MKGEREGRAQVERVRFEKVRSSDSRWREEQRKTMEGTGGKGGVRVWLHIYIYI